MHLNRSSSPGSTGRPRYATGASGGRLLVSDVRTLSLFVNEARYRGFERVLGLRRDQANLATAVAVIATAEAAHRGRVRLKLPAPSVGAFVFANAGLRELILGPPKPGAPEVPVFGGMLAVAAGGTLIIALGGSLDGVRAAALVFVRRYGRQVRRARGAITAGTPRLSERD